MVIFDGDDTLWSTEPLYDDARAAAAEIVERAGLDAGEWERLERDIDVQNVQRFGLSSERFPTSCVEAYQTLARESSGPSIQMSPQTFDTRRRRSFAAGLRSCRPLGQFLRDSNPDIGLCY